MVCLCYKAVPSISGSTEYVVEEHAFYQTKSEPKNLVPEGVSVERIRRRQKKFFFVEEGELHFLKAVSTTMVGLSAVQEFWKAFL